MQSRTSLLSSPTTSHISVLPGLQTNFYITYMRETFNKIGSPKMKGCSKHAQQPMSFFCQKCGFAICRDCTVLDHKDADGHSIQVPNFSFPIFRSHVFAQNAMLHRNTTICHILICIAQ